MSWNGYWFGQWQGDWLGVQGEDDGSIHGWSSVTLASVIGTATGTVAATDVTGTSAAQLDGAYGDASGTLAIAGASTATLGNTVAGQAQQPGDQRQGGGVYFTSDVRRVIRGESAVTLDDVTGKASGTVAAVNVVNLRRRNGRRDDLDMLDLKAVSGWR